MVLNLNLISISCRASTVLQVTHFDKLRENEVRLIRTLHGNINQSAPSAVGTLAGKAEK